MFGRLKKSLREGISKLSRKAEGTEEKAKEKVKEPAKKEPKVEKPAEKKPEKKVKPKKEPKVEKPKVEKPEVKKPAETEEQAKEPAKEEKPEKRGLVERIRERRVKVAPEPEEPKIEKPVEEPEPEEPEFPGEPEAPEPEIKETEREEKPGRFRLGLRERISKRILTENDIDSFFEEGELELLQSDVALEVIDSLKDGLKKRLVDNPVKRGSTSEIVEDAFRESLAEILDQGKVDIEKVIRDARKAGKPACIVFLGFNGSGKTTTIARVANYLKKRGHRPVLAAGDTFRAASIEQLEVHGERLGIKVVKHQYGSDSAAVIFDAVKYAKGKGHDVVLADTAGRSHRDRNLMDELKKVVRVNTPELKVLVVDSLTGNDAVEQARDFDEAAGVDSVVMTKTDVNPKGGSILSVCFAIKKPILFLGTGQEYEDLEIFRPEKFAQNLLE
jgi:fused signal recognition particle receptor